MKFYAVTKSGNCTVIDAPDAEAVEAYDPALLRVRKATEEDVKDFLRAGRHDPNHPGEPAVARIGEDDRERGTLRRWVRANHQGRSQRGGRVIISEMELTSGTKVVADIEGIMLKQGSGSVWINAQDIRDIVAIAQLVGVSKAAATHDEKAAYEAGVLKGAHSQLADEDAPSFEEWLRGKPQW